MKNNLGGFADLESALEFSPPEKPKINGSQLIELFGNLPKFRAVCCDPAWKGDDNHQEGCDAAIATIDTYSIAGQMDFVLLDLTVSNPTRVGVDYPSDLLRDLAAPAAHRRRHRRQQALVHQRALPAPADARHHHKPVQRDPHGQVLQVVHRRPRQGQP